MNKTRIKIGIYGISLLMMGVIGVSGALSTIGANFPEASQTMIQNIVSIPCLVVIPVTLLVGKLMDLFSKKLLAIVGILLFLVGGVGPMFMSSLTGILVLRGVFGVAIGIIQPVSSALVAENFEGSERERVQGNSTSAQMLGCAVMVFAGGWLATMSWEKTFIVHLVGVIALVLAVVCLPNTKPQRQATAEKTASKAKLTKASWAWAGTMFLLFVGGQVHSVYMAYIVSEKQLGTAAQSGNTLAFFAVGGFLLGLVYGKLASKTGKLTLATGLIGIVAAYLLIAFAISMQMIYLGAFLFGISLSICMPCVIVGTAGSVPLAASGM
ncbi:MAG: MFS transporter, partial [Anaerotignum sp.]